MSELSKFINLMIEYGQKVESTLNKKYKPFIRSICNLEQLAKTIAPQNIVLTRQMIIFKLGLQAKTTKSIEISLIYLHKLFVSKFIDLSVPNYCQQFQIQQNNVRKKQNILIKYDFRSQILRLLQPLIHFKSPQINLLLLRVYQNLLTQPIAPILIQLTLCTPCQLSQKILYNYFSYRFYIYQQIYTFTEKQFKSVNPLVFRNQRINTQVDKALGLHQELLDLVHKYVGEIVVAVSGIGGKYGLCVICRQNADYYCKITKASLCGAQCKKKHLQMAEKQYKMHYQAVNLWKQIQPNFLNLLETLSKKQSGSLLAVLVSLLQKPHLYMIVKTTFRKMIGSHVTSIVNNALNYKDESSFQNIYSLIAVLTRFWMLQSMSSIEYFFRESLLKILQDKKPSFKLIIIVFKTLVKIFEYGKVAIELYINFDCQYNKPNFVERIIFQISRICQDKFSSTIQYNKHQKIALKNSAFTILHVLSKGLNQYRLTYPEKIYFEEILQMKQKKLNIDKFLLKFNQHWSEGLKTLFNLNMVGLQSEVQIFQLLTSTKGLKKQNIQGYLLSQSATSQTQSLLSRYFKNPLIGIVNLFKIIPLKKSSVVIKKYIDSASQSMQEKIDADMINKWINFLNSTYKLTDLKVWIEQEKIKLTQNQIEKLYMQCLETKEQKTTGGNKAYFRHCISQSYLQVLAPQLCLLQIPMLFLLQTGYNNQRIFQVISELLQICPHANWISLVLKNVDVEKIRTSKYTQQDHNLISGCLKLIKKHAEYISDWSLILTFICKITKIVSLNDNIFGDKEEGAKLRQEISVVEIQEYLISIGDTSKGNFNNFIGSLIKLSQEELEKEQVFFLQKTFQIIQNNLPKFIINSAFILKQLQSLILKHQSPQKQVALKPIKNKLITYSTQTLIYILDMLKQLLAKILKHPQNPAKIQLNFFRLFSHILSFQNRQVNDFVMNSISMIIMHHYHLKYQTWVYILGILKEYQHTYRQQTLNILQKVLKQSMIGLKNLWLEILSLAIQLVDRRQVKISTQTIHLLKDFVALMVQQHQNQQVQLQLIKQNSEKQQKQAPAEENNQEIRQLKQVKQEMKNSQMIESSLICQQMNQSRIIRYLIFIVQNIIDYISYDCHQGAIEVLFILLKTKISVQRQLLLTHQQVDIIIAKIFQKLEGLPKQLITRGEKIMNESLFWSVRNKSYGIIKNLQNCIIGKYSSLSHCAMKCIKTFISMTNPKRAQQWKPIQQSLVKILTNTHLSSIYSQSSPLSLQNLNFNQPTGISLIQLSNKLIIQRLTVQVLPNDVKIVEELMGIYQETRQFNDNIALRLRLWRQGLGQQIDSPPDILSLEELISYRIISTYYWSKQHTKIAEFTCQILQRFCQSAKRWQNLQQKSKKMQDSASDLEYELFMIQKEYWLKRRQPLKVIINYMLPKLPKICKSYDNKQQIIAAILQGIKFCQEREAYIKTIRQLTLVR